MPLSAMLFDLDGTLVDSLPDIRASTNDLRQQYGLPVLDLEAVQGMVGDGMLKLLERALAELGCRAGEVLEEALAFYRAHHNEQCTRLVQPFPGVLSHLRRWQEEGHPLAVVTNKPRAFATKILDHLDLTPYLPVVIGGDSLEQRKPAPEPVWEALRRLGLPREAGGLMVGDSVGDIRAGKAAGLQTAAAIFGYRPEAELRQTDPDEIWPCFGHGH